VFDNPREDHAVASIDSFKARQTLEAGGKTYTYYSIPEAEKNGLASAAALPFSMKVILENLLRYEDDRSVKKADIAAAVEEAKKAKDEAAHLRATMQQEIAKGHEEVRELIARARADADRLKQQREAEAETVIAAERERFEREKSTARDQALHDLWSQAAELAALVSSKVIRRQLSAEDHRTLVDEALNELQLAAAQRHRSDGSAT
jgi:F0F1-type ATP synthase membrane subunit b/b'